MLNPDNNLATEHHDPIAGFRTQQYHQIITELSIKKSTSLALFTEATTQAIQLTQAPVAILSPIAEGGYQIGAIAGLELFDKLSNDSDLAIELAGIEYCHHQTMNCDRVFAIDNCLKYPELKNTSLCQKHGIRSYLGTPIITAAGNRLGVISILDFTPQQFSNVATQVSARQRDVDLLQLISRWLASEFERKFLSQTQLNHRIGDLHDRSNYGFDDRTAASEYHQLTDKFPIDPNSTLPDNSQLAGSRLAQDRDPPPTHARAESEIQFKLLAHLAQKLRTPLTSVLGMASVLQQEIYGPLSNKQKDYLGIIHNSGQQLVSIVDEIAQLGVFDRQHHQLNLKSVDVEMLCQLAIQSLEPLAKQKEQRISLLPTTGNRLWLLDKDKVRQIIYYLSLSAIEASSNRRQISIQLSRLTDRFQIQITTNDPHCTLLDPLTGEKSGSQSLLSSYSNDNEIAQDLRISLGLSLSCTLAALHGGKIEIMPNRRGYQFSLEGRG